MSEGRACHGRARRLRFEVPLGAIPSGSIPDPPYTSHSPVHVFRISRRLGFEVLPTATGEPTEEMRTYALLMQEPLVLAKWVDGPRVPV